MALQSLMSVIMLGSFIWVVLYLFPKARREDDRFFPIVCALLAALVALAGWLLVATSTR